MVAGGVADGTRCFGRCLAGAVQEGVAGGGRRDHAPSVLLRPTYDPGANPGVTGIELGDVRGGVRLLASCSPIAPIASRGVWQTLGVVQRAVERRLL
jgi:hypothetical protein